jgi:hypothetical protein
MSVKIRQRFRVTDGIGVEDGQHSKIEREREDVDDSEAKATRVAGSGYGDDRLGQRQPRAATRW